MISKTQLHFISAVFVLPTAAAPIYLQTTKWNEMTTQKRQKPFAIYIYTHDFERCIKMVYYVICANGGPNYPLECRICLWIFESKSELEIHNYLEHMIMNGGT